IAERASIIYAGSPVEPGAQDDILNSPAHTYTRGLLKAMPTLKSNRARPLETIEGTMPSLQAIPPGCSFEPRCDFRVPKCATALPPLVEVAPGHWARCPVVNPLE